MTAKRKLYKSIFNQSCTEEIIIIIIMIIIIFNESLYRIFVQSYHIYTRYIYTLLSIKSFKINRTKGKEILSYMN